MAERNDRKLRMDGGFKGERKERKMYKGKEGQLASKGGWQDKLKEEI